MRLYPKFIIEGDSIVIGMVTYHKELAMVGNHVKSGGSFEMDTTNKILTFFGCSHDFGCAKLEDIKQAVNGGKVYSNKYKIYSMHDKYSIRYRDKNNELTILKV